MEQYSQEQLWVLRSRKSLITQEQHGDPIVFQIQLLAAEVLYRDWRIWGMIRKIIFHRAFLNEKAKNKRNLTYIRKRGALSPQVCNEAFSSCPSSMSSKIDARLDWTRFQLCATLIASWEVFSVPEQSFDIVHFQILKIFTSLYGLTFMTVR